ncbi:MBOAT family O-acyltransferase [Oceanicola sp. S124]|uniref:MBOAT family O-acyltransferase n=1 Tax=Oceanicola sp. S124 TaxID=1042378 RepID=UPI000255A3E0|nr:MBOAT family protein [Oceanicola sp. S124]
MVFPTLDFVLFFALVLGLNLALFRLNGWRKGMLIAASFWFYAVWDVRFLALMSAVILLAWIGGLPGARKATALRTLCIAGLLGCLAFFKYFNFFLLSFSNLLGEAGLSRDFSWAQVVLPVGISFYVFQAISYIVDCAREDVPARRNPFDVALYVSFFPQLVAGPIVRAADFLPQLDRPERPTSAMRGMAVALILAGMVKKLVVANYIAVLLVDPVYTNPAAQGAPQALAALLGYAVQIYCDFSGYSDIAIGVALLLGYRFSANFNQPYRAASFREFWQRWHISLSTWIRDYLYIPLGGNRGGKARQAVTLLVVMGLAGLWHGAAWTFVLWGLAHGALVAGERLSGQHRATSLRPLRIGVVFTLVTLLWLPFRARNMGQVGEMLGALARPASEFSLALHPFALVLIGTGLLISALPLRWFTRSGEALGRVGPELQAGVLALGLVILFAMAQEGTAPFIYFQF